MMIEKEKFLIYFKILLVVLLLSSYGFFLSRKIDLTTADLGRHLKNGELILNSTKFFNFKNSILHANFYSYTYPDYLFVNHHWGAGVIFFIIQKVFGFVGLSLFYFVLSLITFYLFFRLAERMAGFKISFLVSLLLIPLIAERTEIRPEVFTYFFSVLFFWILWHYKQNFISYRWLFILPFLMLFWVNIHIYFFVGLILIGLFLLEAIFFRKYRPKIKWLSTTLILTVATSLINPFGLKGFLYPLNIFKNYGYLIVENQSVLFLDKWGLNNPNLLLFKIVFAISALSFVLVIIFNRKNFSFVYFCLGAGLGIMAWLALRNFTIFAFFTLPIIAYNFSQIKNRSPKLQINNLIFVIFLLLIIVGLFFNQRQQLSLHSQIFGLGLMSNNDASARFFLKENIQGPILNNYDIGSYLIYHLFPKYRVFVDNRPEAYPNVFFQKIYIPLQNDEEKWQTEEQRYNFNAIFFSHRDLTPWAQKFLINRVNDSSWAPVFADPYAIIFLKRNEINRPIIEKYEIPKEFFRIVQLP